MLQQNVVEKSIFTSTARTTFPRSYSDHRTYLVVKHKFFGRINNIETPSSSSELKVVVSHHHCHVSCLKYLGAEWWDRDSSAEASPSTTTDNFNEFTSRFLVHVAFHLQHYKLLQSAN